jgi:hypothetical protein
MESGESSEKSAVSSARLSLAHPCSQLDLHTCESSSAVLILVCQYGRRGFAGLQNTLTHADISFDTIRSLLTLVGLFLHGLMQTHTRNGQGTRARTEEGWKEVMLPIASRSHARSLSEFLSLEIATLSPAPPVCLPLFRPLPPTAYSARVNASDVLTWIQHLAAPRKVRIAEPRAQ